MVHGSTPSVPEIDESATHELEANDLASEKLRRLIIEHLGDFFSDTAECFRILPDFRRLDYFLFDRQILRPALSAGPPLITVLTAIASI
jgi:hypothetical protein